MKRLRNKKGLLEALVVIGLILLIPLFFTMRTTAEQNAAQNTSAPPLPTVVINAPAGSNALAPKQPSACTFPLAQITPTDTPPENYTFSEPKVVLTSVDNRYNIVNWLPDNQQVLITQDLYDITKNENGKYLRQSIELYNPNTGEQQIYAIRYHTESPPLWQEKLNAVIYPHMNFLGIDENAHKLKFTRQIWVSYGNPDTAQMLSDNLPQFPHAVKPGGDEMIYLSDKKISKRDKSLKEITSNPFDLNQWDYAKTRRNETPVSYNMDWQPNTSLIFLHSNGGMQEGGGYTFILDTDTGRICELNLDGWAVQAHWSSDGHYLAFIKATISSSPVNTTDLVVLDTISGKTYTVEVTPKELEGKHYVDDFVWAPDNYHLLVVASVVPFHGTKQEGASGLHLVDFISGQSVNILSAYKFYANSSQSNLAWSFDGSKLLARCPTMEEERVCYIDVQKVKE